MQLRMSPTGGMPSSSRSTPDEPPSSATVTTAVRLLVCSLSPRSSVGQPRAAADRHDPRPAGEEALLVDDLDERLVAIRRRAAGPSATRTTRYAPSATQRDPDTADDQPAQRERQELERQRRRSGCRRCRPARGPGRPGAARGRPPSASSSSPTNATSSQRLTPIPGVSQRRRFTAGRARGGRRRPDPKSRSRSQVASSSAMTIERW